MTFILRLKRRAVERIVAGFPLLSSKYLPGLSEGYKHNDYHFHGNFLHPLILKNTGNFDKTENKLFNTFCY